MTLKPEKPRKPMPEAHRHAISRGKLHRSRRDREAKEKLRQSALITSREMRRLRHSGTVAASLAPALEASFDEAGEIADALGGPANLTARQLALIRTYNRCAFVEAGASMRYAQAPDDLDAARLILAAGTAKRSVLNQLRDEDAASVVTLSEYLDARSSADSPDTKPTDAADPQEAPEDAPRLTIDPRLDWRPASVDELKGDDDVESS
jgi:hypothetical protein